ncbi:MAG: hypothetical protein IJM35_01835 [Bacteroidales bacterium]|nr:hypothetical protein [Bacteroidales bacterium]
MSQKGSGQDVKVSVSGYVHSLTFDRTAGSLGITSLPLWDAPVMIIDRSAVPMTTK